MPTRDTRERISPYVAAILERERAKRGLSQTALETLTGISQSAISKYLRVERVIDIDRLDALCAALGLDIVAVVHEAVQTRARRS